MTDLFRMSRGDSQREKVYRKREERKLSRSRAVTCSICDSRIYSRRHKDDICDECLGRIWGAEDAGRNAQAAGENMVNVKFSERAHDFPYPSLGCGNNIDVPENAVFARPDAHSFRKVNDAPRTMQRLFLEILEGLGKAYPGDRESKRTGMTMFADSHSFNLTAAMPKQSAAAILDLWSFIPWVANATYQQGFEDGKAMLSALALGTMTMDDFEKKVIEQTERIRRNLDKSETGNMSRY